MPWWSPLLGISGLLTDKDFTDKAAGFLREKYSREKTAKEGKAEQESAVTDYSTGLESLLGDYANKAGESLSKYETSAGQNLANYLTRATGNISDYQTAAQKSLGDYRGTALSDISKGLASQTGLVDESIGELEKLFKEDYYSDYLNRPEVANAIRQKQEQFRESLNQFKGNAVRGGGTIESQLAASGTLGKNYSNFLADLVAEGEARKSGLKSDYLSRKSGLNLQKAGLIGTATGQRLGVGGNVLSGQQSTLANVLSSGQNVAGTGLQTGQNIAGNVMQGGQNIANTLLGVGAGAKGNILQSTLDTSKGFTDAMLNIKQDRGAALSQGLNQIIQGIQNNPEILASILGSDVKFKKDIKYLITINGVKFYSFKYKDTDKFPKGKQIGVLAQEVENIPNAVIEKEDGKYVNYNVIKSYINEFRA